MCPDCSDSGTRDSLYGKPIHFAPHLFPSLEKVGGWPGTLSLSGQSLPDSENLWTSEPLHFPTPHTYTLLFLVIGLSYFLKYSRERLGYPNTSPSLRIVFEGCWGKRCPTFSFSSVVPREHRWASAGWYNSRGLPGEGEFRAKRTCSPHPGFCLFVCFIKSRMWRKALVGRFLLQSGQQCKVRFLSSLDKFLFHIPWTANE